MMGLGIGAWVAAHLHTTPARQDEISQALKQAGQQNSDANRRNFEASEKAIAEPLVIAETPDAKTGIEDLLSQINKKRKQRRDQAF